MRLILFVITLLFLRKNHSEILDPFPRPIKEEVMIAKELPN